LADQPGKQASNPVKKVKRGPKPKSGVARMRIDVWYQTVKNRLGWSDSQLDVYFDLFGTEIALNPNTGRKDPEARRRIFESIRTHQRDPRCIKLGDKTIDLVALVDSETGYGWTKWTFDAPIWDLMLSPPRLEETQIRLRALMDEFGMTFMPRPQYWELQSRAVGMKPARLYHNCLRYTLGMAKKIIGLSLVGLLYRQSYLAGEFALTEELAILFDTQCAHFYNELYLDTADTKRKSGHISKLWKYYSATNHAVLGGYRDSDDPPPGSRSFLESPIVFQEVLDNPELWSGMILHVS